MAKQTAEETLKGLVGLIVIGVVAYFYFSKDSTHVVPSSSSIEAAPVGEESPIPPGPPAEIRFIDIVRQGAASYAAGTNDMAKGAAKPARAAAFADLFASGHTILIPWTGKIETLSTNGDGKGVLKVRIAQGITVSTTNNDFSDIGEETLIDPRSRVFQQAERLREGQLVRFKGTFISDGTSGVRERSLLMENSMAEPDFAMRFTDIQPLN
jgi:hypothetical protein